MKCFVCFIFQISDNGRGASGNLLRIMHVLLKRISGITIFLCDHTLLLFGGHMEL